mgnify:CR=1 FL=1
MISRVSEKAAEYFAQIGTIPHEDKDLYSYGFFLLFSYLFFFMLTVLYGFLFRIPFESMLFYMMFIAIRSYAGGFHASKESTCTISTSIALFVSVFIIRYLTVLKLIIFPFILSVICQILIVMYAPLDSEARRLTSKEKKKYREKSFFIGVVIICIGAFFIQIRYSIFCTCVVSLALESFLLVLSKIRRYRASGK